MGQKQIIMKTTEILAAFLKGSTFAIISIKQKNWLEGQAQKEEVFDRFNDIVYSDNCHYQIKQCQQLASGGSYVCRVAVQGRFKIEKMYFIEFDNGFKRVCNSTDIEHFEREGYSFKKISLKDEVKIQS